jgi:hypothetical protein
MRTTIYFLFACILLFTSCKKKSFVVDEYPVQSGKTWNYDIKYHTYNFRPIQPGATFHLDSLHWTGKVEAKGKVTLPNSLRADKFESIESSPHTTQTYSGANYYVNRSDTMFRVAYSYNGASQFLPKNINENEFLFLNKKFHSMFEIFKFAENGFVESNFSSDSLVLGTKPVIPFVFPLKIGKEWLYVNNEDFPISKINKKVIGKTSLTIDSINYSAYKIQWFLFNNDNQLDTNGFFYDYMGSAGLLKREFIIKNMLVTDENSPDGFGYLDAQYEYTATSFSK